ncbi:hypothetical protein E4U26_002594 [Claviceps purpurea]|nr:hypothetical protein E4U26_002594 [Claviceps purpurea]
MSSASSRGGRHDGDDDGDGGGRRADARMRGWLNVRDAWCVDAVVDACSVDSARMETRLAARRMYLTYQSIQDAGHAALIPADSPAHALDWYFSSSSPTLDSERVIKPVRYRQLSKVLVQSPGPTQRTCGKYDDARFRETTTLSSSCSLVLRTVAVAMRQPRTRIANTLPATGATVEAGRGSPENTPRGLVAEWFVLPCVGSVRQP